MGDGLRTIPLAPLGGTMLEQLIEEIFRLFARLIVGTFVFLLAHLLVSGAALAALYTLYARDFARDSWTFVGGVFLTPFFLLLVLRLIHRPGFNVVWRLMMVWRTKVLARYRLSTAFRDLSLDAQSKGEVFKAPGIGRVKVK